MPYVLLVEPENLFLTSKGSLKSLQEPYFPFFFCSLSLFPYLSLLSSLLFSFLLLLLLFFCLFLLLTFLLSFMGLNMLSKMAINSLLDSCDLVALTSQNAETTDVCCNAQLENEFVDDTNIPFMRK